MTRANLLRNICDLIGSTVAVVDPRDGWPGIVDVTIPSGTRVRVALHVSQAGSHARRAYERRFQNPATRPPVLDVDGLPVLLGLEEIGGRPILVAVDGSPRVGRERRFSILFKDTAISQARRTGWGIYQSNTGERIYTFIPAMMPVYIQLLRSNLEPDFSEPASRSIQVAVAASGILDDSSETASARARRTVNILIRDYSFGGSVVRAYNSLCAMCGIDSGLVVGAHIFPVEAPNSPDDVWNGLALCQNHHAAFDQHKVCVHPETRSITFRPDMSNPETASPALLAFIGGTFTELSPPAEAINNPKREMFHARYDFYKNEYRWAAS